MINYDASRCTACGLCADLCHESCITLDDGGLHIDRSVCSTCAQCVAACPNQALSWNGDAPLAFERTRLPSIDQIDELFKQRRSIRRFKDRKIDRALLEEITTYGAYAPTHAFNQRAIIIDDDELIGTLDQMIVENCRRIHRLAYRLRILAWIANWLGYGDEMTKARPKIENALARGHAFSSMPAAFILVIGDKKTALAEASAQYALANMMYYAQLKGVGTCLWGNGPIFIDKNRQARRMLGMASNERIYGALFMGYPAVRFSNKVSGRKLGIQWNGAPL